jgi:predicted nucleic acid-binding protein
LKKVGYVIDASVITKCFIVEDLSDKAIGVVKAFSSGRFSLTAPSLIFYELATCSGGTPKSMLNKPRVF